MATPYDYVESGDGVQVRVYSESWSVYRDLEGRLWRVKPDDIRVSYQLCRKGAAIGKSDPVVDKIPLAPKMSPAEVEEITQYNQTHQLGWGQRHLVRHEKDDLRN
jgi:hypothetical protein